jgi:hypothetical protein
MSMYVLNFLVTALPFHSAKCTDKTEELTHLSPSRGDQWLSNLSFLIQQSRIMNAAFTSMRRMVRPVGQQVRNMGAGNPPTLRPHTWNPISVYGLTFFLIAGGFGTVTFAVRHQNRKHGFDKNPNLH